MWTQQPDRSTVVSSSKQRNTCIIHHLVRQSIIELDTCRPLSLLAPSRLDNNPATKLVKSNMRQVNKTITRSLSFCFISSNDDALVNTRPNTLWNKTIPICNTFGDNGACQSRSRAELTHRPKVCRVIVRLSIVDLRGHENWCANYRPKHSCKQNTERPI